MYKDMYPSFTKILFFDAEALSEGVKILKGQYLLQAITKHEMDQVNCACSLAVEVLFVHTYSILVSTSYV